MKIKSGFELRDVCGEHVVIAYGEQNIDFSRVISFNESAAFLWEAVKDKEFTPQELADLLCQEYDVDAATALSDVEGMLQQWNEQGLLE